MPDCFVKDNRDGVGEVEAARGRAHRQADFLWVFQRGMNERRQSGGFAAKEKDVIGADGRVVKTALTFGGQRPDVAPGDGLEKRRPVVVMVDVGELGVIQPGATQAAVVPGKAQRVDEVQHRAGIGAEADDVAGVGRDLRLVKGDVLHDEGLMLARQRTCMGGFQAGNQPLNHQPAHRRGQNRFCHMAEDDAARAEQPGAKADERQRAEDESSKVGGGGIEGAAEVVVGGVDEKNHALKAKKKRGAAAVKAQQGGGVVVEFEPLRQRVAQQEQREANDGDGQPVELQRRRERLPYAVVARRARVLPDDGGDCGGK